MTHPLAGPRPAPLYLAHAFGERYTLPLPLLLFVLGGAVVVVASFLLVVPRAVEAGQNADAADRVSLEPARPVLNALSVAALIALVLCGVRGSQEVPENILPTLFWLIAWIAVPLSCGVLGDWTRPVNPLRALARAADRPALRRRLFGSPEPLAWPTWLAWWPAVATFLFLVGGELVFNATATLPRMIAYGLVVAVVASLLAGLAVGADAWLNRGEMFSVLFSTWGRLGRWRFGAPGRAGFAGGLQAPFDASMSRVVFVLMLLASVAFDGILSTPDWRRVHLHLINAFGGSTDDTDAVTLAVFVALVAVMLAAFGAFAIAVARTAGRTDGLIRSLAVLLPSLAPISFGYLIAHNIDNLSINGQLLIPLIGNPTGTHQWLPAPFNDDYEVKLKLIPPALTWYVAVAAIVLAHVVAVVLAHGYLARTGATDRQARRSEYPWLVAMVAYTMVSLWLLAQPLTQEKSTPQEHTASSVAPGFALRSGW